MTLPKCWYAPRSHRSKRPGREEFRSRWKKRTGACLATVFAAAPARGVNLRASTERRRRGCDGSGVEGVDRGKEADAFVRPVERKLGGWAAKSQKCSTWNILYRVAC